jgi:hypothetical protein
VFFHHRNQHFARQLQKFGVEAAQDGGGLFDQVRHFVEQVFFDEGFAAHLRRGLPDLLHDGGFALFFVEDDAGGAHQVEVAVGGGDGDFGRIIRAQAAADAAACNARVFKRDDRLAEEGDQPADGTREGDAAVVPSHGLLEFDFGNEFGQRFGEDLGRGASRLLDDGEDVFAARWRVLADLQVGDVHAVFPGKALGGGGGVAAWVEGLIGRRPLDEGLAVGLLGAEIGHENGEPARGRGDSDAAVGEMQFLEQGRHTGGELLTGRVHVGGG